MKHVDPPERGRCSPAAGRAGPPARASSTRPATRAIAVNSFISPNKVYLTKRASPTPCICSPSCSCCSWPFRLARTRAGGTTARATDPRRNRAALRNPVHEPFAVCISMPAGKLIMMSKRKREEELDDEAKGKRVRKRSRSEPRYDTDNPEKREVLRRLFGRSASEESSRPAADDRIEDDVLAPDDDNDDLLFDEVPVNLDPEQLGFLMCAQETLRFLQERGLTLQHPMLARLRTHFIDSFHHIALA